VIFGDLFEAYPYNGQFYAVVWIAKVLGCSPKDLMPE